jgi:hypothetical protein
MVDCFDRIAVQMTELALEPIRLLAQRSMLHAVSLRTASNGRRFSVTVARRIVDDEKSPRYVWQIEEIEPSGEVKPGGAAVALPIAQAFADPETAYWSAIDRLCEITRANR